MNFCNLLKLFTSLVEIVCLDGVEIVITFAVKDNDYDYRYTESILYIADGMR